MRKTTYRENPIATRSRTALIAAADELLSARPASEISIKDIVETAGMSRPTFYQHFNDLGTLFAAAGLTRLSAMFDTISHSLSALVSSMECDAEFYWHVYDSTGGTQFQAGAIELTAAWLPGLPELANLPEDAALKDFLAAGVVWAITKHLAAYCNNPQHPDSEPVEELTRIFHQVVPETA